MPLPERTLSFSAAAAGAEGSGTPAGGREAAARGAGCRCPDSGSARGGGDGRGQPPPSCSVVYRKLSNMNPFAFKKIRVYRTRYGIEARWPPAAAQVRTSAGAA